MFLALLFALGSGTSAPGADDPAPFPDMGKAVCELLKKHYYDPKRFHPRVMVERALRALETSEMSIDTTWLGESIVLHIGDSPRQKVNAPEPKDVDEAMAIIEQVRIRVDAADFPPARRRDLDYVLMNGALLSLDPHTLLLPPEPAKEFSEDIQGEFYGIGAYLAQDEGVVTIERVMPGLPADRAGVEDGDVILGIDSEKTAGLSLDQAVKRIKGPKGSTVILTLERKGVAEPIDLPIVRDLVQVISTRSFRTGDVGYLRMDDFSANTAHELYSALQELQQPGPLKAFVIDLRYNGGGLLDQAKLISNFFLPKAREIVRTVTNDGKADISKSSGKPILGDVPMVVLVSGGSASAAEILSGALQCNDRAVVAGTTTFGKGSVQAVKPLHDGSKLKLTIQEYQLPGGVSIQDVGVTPDLRLIRHSVREDGTVDLVPFTREREVDDDFALENKKPYEHKSTYEVGWVAPHLTKDQQKQSNISARDFHPDQESSLILDILVDAVAQPGYAEDALAARKANTLRQFLLERMKAPVAKRSEIEAQALATLLSKRSTPIDWGDKSLAASGSLTLSFNGPATLNAGDPASLSFTIANSASTDTGRLFGLVKADKMSPFWEEELLFGQVPANGSATGIMAFKVPPRLYSGQERFTVEVYSDGASAPLASLPVSVEVRSLLRPHFSYSWRLDEPSGDGQLDPGETARVHLTLRNDGDAASSKVKLYVFKSDDPYVQLGEVRFTFDAGIPMGGEVTAKVPITVLKEVKRGGVAVPFSAESVKLQVRAEEVFPDDISGLYRSTLFNTMTIPVAQPLAEGRVVQPMVVLDALETQADNRHKLRLKVTDDNLKFISLFQDEDKVDLESAGVLTATGQDRADAAVKSSVYETFVTLKPGLNTLRIVAMDRDDVTEVLPLRVWGPEVATPPRTASTTPVPAATPGSSPETAVP
ncbi:MAG: PDZ domain-containing protein [Planctomycetes bacterium]|nr:PDZ domain-containing protein [Planctomycetota bacterium]